MILKREVNLVFLNLLSFILMISVNAQANISLFNGVTTGEVSDLYPNLYAPAGITFSIWGLIYLLLAGFVIYQLVYFKDKNTGEITKIIGNYFIVSSLANTAWIYSWHYKIIPLSMILMVVILVSLIAINTRLNSRELNLRENIFVRLPFSVYFGWITVATIANVTVLLVSLDWNGWGLSQQFWTIIVLGIGLVIGMAVKIKNNDVAYGLVIFWAYLGILTRHISPGGFAGKYPEIIIALSISLVVILILIIFGNRFRSVKLIGINEQN